MSVSVGVVVDGGGGVTYIHTYTCISLCVWRCVHGLLDAYMWLLSYSPAMLRLQRYNVATTFVVVVFVVIIVVVDDDGARSINENVVRWLCLW